MWIEPRKEEDQSVGVCVVPLKMKKNSSSRNSQRAKSPAASNANFLNRRGLRIIEPKNPTPNIMAATRIARTIW
jgi:hypothetical protein